MSAARAAASPPELTGPQLRGWLAGVPITQARAAALVGVSDRTMRRYCAGESRIPAAVRQVLFTRLGRPDFLVARP